MQNNVDSEGSNRQQNKVTASSFLSGVLIGVVVTFAVMTLRNGNAVLSEVDLSAIQNAAAQGAATAIAMQQQTAYSETSPEPASAASQSSATGQRMGPEKPPVEQDVDASKSIALREANIQGNADAPVTVIEFSDFNCGYCLRFHQQTYPALVEQYVKTGKIRFVYKQFAVLGDDSVLAAQASECAADQNRFWEYHDALFAMRVAGEGFSTDSLMASAEALKLDTVQFSACLKNNETADRVQTDFGEAQKLKFSGTPTFLVNGKILVGAQPFEVFQRELDSALAQQ